jgi:hypothetical protein
MGAGGAGTVVVVVGFGQPKKHRAWAGAAVTNGATSTKPVIKNTAPRRRMPLSRT